MEKRISTQILEADGNQKAIAQFQEYVKSNPFTHYKQSFDWCEVSDRSQFLLAVSECRDSVVCCSLIRKRKFPFLGRAKYFIERGPTALDSEHMRLHLAHVLEILAPSMLSLIVNPYYGQKDWRLASEKLLSLGFQNCRIGGYYQRTLTINLAQPTEDIYGTFSTKLRRNIKMAERYGMHCVEVKHRNQRRSFYKAYDEFRQKHAGSGCLPINELEECFHTGRERFCLMIAAELDGKLVGGVVVLISGTRAIYEYGFRSDYATQCGLPALHLPLWVAIKRCKEMGVGVFDMGGYAPEEINFRSISRFKRYFTGHEQMVLGEYKFVPKEAIPRLFDVVARLMYR